MKKIIFFVLMSILVSGCAMFNHKTSGKNSLDEVPFKELNWVYGGLTGVKSEYSLATITGLSASGNNMSYKWTVDSVTATKALNSADKVKADLVACLFVKNSSGKWVGGKFEWISVSRTTRQFGNILNKHYNGWSLNGVPNPCDCAFVIVNPVTKTRTNVVKGVWKR